MFLMNCAHCHGDDTRGDEGPDLHNPHRAMPEFMRWLPPESKARCHLSGRSWATQT